MKAGILTEIETNWKKCVTNNDFVIIESLSYKDFFAAKKTLILTTCEKLKFIIFKIYSLLYYLANTVEEACKPDTSVSLEVPISVWEEPSPPFYRSFFLKHNIYPLLFFLCFPK